ncbi:DUF2357 domain-containing protein [Psychrobacter phenylpyruvicus]|uniref:Domain of uncharacterized function (DUF2357) n=1 Tax=Psychrobacter phenylpyruvicus TaxID=29432 RepID=A0A379LJU1_9GAMM|nr:DUF2357 domain-containing protein [Psychrobacter phenylpyruvicus]SUD90044.1 Domain of uncharacterised function (DUF2357) [Psychrobacter phenylpyruvicus]
MSELLYIQTPEFELNIWCNDISKRQSAYKDTLAKRKASVEDNSISIRLSPAIAVTKAIFMGNELDLDTELNHSALETVITIEHPIFFENLQYHFEWLFITNEANTAESNSVIPVNNAFLAHRSHLINESFRFAPANRSIPARLTGSINTSNHLGWMRLPLQYVKAEKSFESKLAFEVLPTKMSLHDDLPLMYQTIDEVFPLWRFSLVAPTEQDAASSQQRNFFPLLWLASFTELRQQFEHGLKVISQAPHSRLQSHTAYNKANRLKGRVSHRLATKIKEDFKNGLSDRRYPTTKKQLSVNTPENQFIKMVVSTTLKRLTSFENKLRVINAAPDQQRLSEAFLNELHSWQQPLQKILKQSFMQEVSAFSGLSHESLVLQQKVGYSLVYRIWQELKFYLDLFDNQASISMKSVAEIYEIWCFLALRKILIEDLGFEQVTTNRPSLELNDYFEYRLKDGFAGAIEFRRSDGITARLAHEPIFGKKGTKIRSYLTTQKPDIVLEVTLPIQESNNEKRFIWVFDAKYRIKTASNSTDLESDIEITDYAPDDAINQMHRYRDALIRIAEDKAALQLKNSNLSKSRPVIGAFALYPGYFNQTQMENPYHHEIKEVGIGAFALLPSTQQSDTADNNYPLFNTNNYNSGSYWLSQFLIQQIGTATRDIKYSPSEIAERLYIQEPARIPYDGMQQILYPDLTLTIALGDKADRKDSYFNKFEEGTAQWYHLPEKTFLRKYARHVVNELRYLALASSSEQSLASKKINKLWPIISVSLVRREDISDEQAGSNSTKTDRYYLFKLDKPLILKTPIIGVPKDSFMASMSLTTLSSLEQAEQFSQLTQVYKKALSTNPND